MASHARAAKQALRAEMRTQRLAIADRPARSLRVCANLQACAEVARARTVMVFTPIAGEPDVASFTAWCREQGKDVVVPDATRAAVPPADPAIVDVVVVPGVAFTADGRRLGQGGGWYDRFLVGLRDDATAIGVCFDAQVVGDLPIEPHDVVLDLVITESVPTPPR